jgi:hypothetical protein
VKACISHLFCEGLKNRVKRGKGSVMGEIGVGDEIATQGGEKDDDESGR